MLAVSLGEISGPKRGNVGVHVWVYKVAVCVSVSWVGGESGLRMVNVKAYTRVSSG